MRNIVIKRVFLLLGLMLPMAWCCANKAHTNDGGAVSYGHEYYGEFEVRDYFCIFAIGTNPIEH